MEATSKSKTLETKQLTFDPEVREEEVTAVPVDHVRRETTVRRKPVRAASPARDASVARAVHCSFHRRRTVHSLRPYLELRFQQPYPSVELLPLRP